jgi:hypothetical protein
MRGDPIPWKGSALTPAMANSPDQSDDIRGGIGCRESRNLQKFIEEGGPVCNHRRSIEYSD